MTTIIQRATVIILAFCGIMAVYILFWPLVGSSNSVTNKFFKPSEVLLKENREIMGNDFQVTEDEYAKIILNIQDVLKRAPLDDVALVQLARLSGFKNSLSQTKFLLSEARYRNPRNRTALILLYNIASVQNNAKQQLELLKALVRLKEGDVRTHLDNFSILFEKPNGRDEIINELNSNPRWGYHVLNHELKKIGDEQLLSLSEPMNILIKLDSSHPNKIALAAAYIRRLIAAGDYEYADKFWRDIYLQNEDAHVPINILNFNPSFNPILGPLPFNWRLVNSNGVSVDRNSNGGVYASFYGTKTSTVAEQFFYWPDSPELNLKMNYDYRYTKNQGSFSVRLECFSHENRAWKPWVEIILDESLKNTKNFQKSFKRPADTLCEMVKIHLKARPHIFAERISIDVKSIVVEALN